MTGDALCVTWRQSTFYLTCNSDWSFEQCWSRLTFTISWSELIAIKSSLKVQIWSKFDFVNLQFQCSLFINMNVKSSDFHTTLHLLHYHYGAHVSKIMFHVLFKRVKENYQHSISEYSNFYRCHTQVTIRKTFLYPNSWFLCKTVCFGNRNPDSRCYLI